MVKMIKRFTIAEYGVEWRVELAVRVGRYLVSFWDLDSGNRISPTFFIMTLKRRRSTTRENRLSRQVGVMS